MRCPDPGCRNIMTFVCSNKAREYQPFFRCGRCGCEMIGGKSPAIVKASLTKIDRRAS